MESQAVRLIAKNKKAFFNYEILETFETGISLVGSEVKSIREGRISLKESYAEIKEGEVFLVNCHVSPYEASNRFNHEPLRERKLLLHRREIKRLTGKIKERGLTLVPTKVQINDKGKVKVELALAKGKRVYQKRETIRERDRDREMQTELKRWR
ncbi:MAG TPA: SsrA-binding protein SmpB [Candidatus Heimdallarchaeota archaeon]|jgi:SsrA-binding protein|nr:SsrA-binding protein SmpB [Candidatus Heimdallarchaeota archaeon]